MQPRIPRTLLVGRGKVPGGGGHGEESEEEEGGVEQGEEVRVGAGPETIAMH